MTGREQRKRVRSVVARTDRKGVQESVSHSAASNVVAPNIRVSSITRSNRWGRSCGSPEPVFACNGAADPGSKGRRGRP